MQVLIDTNIYLNFYRMSDDSLKTLSELIKLLENEKFVLILPTQIRDEFNRRKYDVVNTEISNIYNTNKFNSISIPVLMRNSSKAKIVNSNLKTIKKLLENIVDEYRKRTISPNSQINKFINKIFKLAKIIEENESIFKKAKRRKIRGNPPQKNDDSIGDAIVWETILENCVNDDLNIISKDSDYCNCLNSGNLNAFLDDEWNNKSKCKIKLYKSLGSYINSFENKKIISEKSIIEEKSLNNVNNLPFSIPSQSVALSSDWNKEAAFDLNKAFSQNVWVDNAAANGSSNYIWKQCEMCGKNYLSFSYMFDDGKCNSCRNQKGFSGTYKWE
ncbi:MAG: hypothetical protein A2231_03510 [Candidatus Firestonebacteria bacterium RIFOXYA2_FULL_40_8]|nr:MAG: hypothetical protein A2231_03510 [Candidatus Firestonebacteria bacterium RIFOXYA2_FULL_40_8]